MEKTNWLDVLKRIATRCLTEIPKVTGSSSGGEIVATKADGDPSTKADTEERGYLIDNPKAEYAVHLDAIDCTFLALRGLPGACVAASVFGIEDMNPIAAIIGDYSSGDAYWATDGGSFLNGKPIRPSTVRKLRDAYVTTCYGKASRFASILDKRGFAGTVFWFGTTSGMLDMARVAAGQIDAYFDLMLGYKIYDFAAGAFIAEKAGAVVTNEEGRPLRYPRDPTKRTKFIIAATDGLLQDILKAASI